MEASFLVSPELSKSPSLLEQECKLPPGFSTQKPLSYPTCLQLGESLYHQNKLDEASVAYSKAIELNPSSFQAHVRLGIIFRKKGKLEEAIRTLDKAIFLNCESIDAHLNLGIALYNKNSFEEAIEAYTKVIQLSPSHVDAYNNLGLVLRKQGKLDEAAKAFQKAIELNPSKSSAYNNLGIVLRNQGNLAEAINAYNTAIKLNPKDAEAYNNLGLALRSQGKLKEAIKAYNKAIEINPKHAGAYNNLGSALFKRGKLEKAVNAFSLAIYLDPSFVLCYCNRGKALNNLDREEEALADFNKAYELIKNEKTKASLSGKNKKYIKQILKGDREEILNRLTYLRKETLSTTNLINSLGKKKTLVQTEIEKFNELRKSIMKVTDQVIDNIQDCEETQDETAKLNNEIKKLQEMHQLLQKQLLEHTKQLEDHSNTIAKHEKAISSAGVYDKAKIIEEFRELAVNSPELYKYCKMFYWTLINYLAAYRTLGTNLIQGNHVADQTTKRKAFEIGLQQIITFTKDLAQGIPIFGGVISLVDETIEDIYNLIHKRRFIRKLNAINQIIMHNNDPNIVLEEGLNLMAASTALGVTKGKRQEILKCCMTKNPAKTVLKKNKTIAEKLFKIKEQILPSISLLECPGTELALEDVLMLLVYLHANYQEIIDSKETLDQQFKMIILEEKWKNSEKVGQENTDLDETSFKNLKSKSSCNLF